MGLLLATEVLQVEPGGACLSRGILVVKIEGVFVFCCTPGLDGMVLDWLQLARPWDGWAHVRHPTALASCCWCHLTCDLQTSGRRSGTRGCRR